MYYLLLFKSNCFNFFSLFKFMLNLTAEEVKERWKMENGSELVGPCFLYRVSISATLCFEWQRNTTIPRQFEYCWKHAFFISTLDYCHDFGLMRARTVYGRCYGKTICFPRNLPPRIVLRCGESTDALSE